MSRWLWALLGGVVLVAIAAVFWIASNQTNVAPPVSPAPAPLTPAPAPAPTCAETSRPPAAALTCASDYAGGCGPPARSAAAPPAPTPAPDAGQQPPRRLLPPRPPRRPRLRRVAQEPSPPPLRPPKRPYRRPRPDGRRRKSRTYMRPRASRSWSGPGPIPRRIASDSFSGAAAAGPFASRWTSSPRPRSSSRRRRSFCLPPPARSMARLKRKAGSR